jgi:hypothetical protein
MHHLASIVKRKFTNFSFALLFIWLCGAGVTEEPYFSNELGPFLKGQRR